MSNRGLSSVMKGIQTVMKKHSPEILTGIGIAGMITTTIMAVRATPKALALIEEEHEQQNTYSIPAKDIVRVTWKCYIPSAIVGSLSICCLVGANSIHLRSKAALAAAYTLKDAALKTYQEKVVEVIGEKKEQTVRDAVAKEQIERNPVTKREIIITEKGNTLCYDAVSGRYFKSDMDKLKKAENELNRQMRDEMYISLNDFYYEIGLSCTRIGGDLGWHIDDGYIDLNFSSQLADDGTPCLVIDYRLAPRYDFRR